MANERRHAWLIGVGLAGGLLLSIIGIRFLLVPESAARTFGVAIPAKGYELHYVIGLRDVWLGLLAVAFAALRQWHALALWGGIGAAVCFADSWIVATSSGAWPLVAFHFGSGIVCIVVALLILRSIRREREGAPE